MNSPLDKYINYSSLNSFIEENKVFLNFKNFISDFKIEKYSKIYLIAHSDADGICSSNLFYRLLSFLFPNIQVHRKYVKNITACYNLGLPADNESTYFFFLDLCLPKNYSAPFSKHNFSIIDHHRETFLFDRSIQLTHKNMFCTTLIIFLLSLSFRLEISINDQFFFLAGICADMSLFVRTNEVNPLLKKIFTNNFAKKFIRLVPKEYGFEKKPLGLLFPELISYFKKKKTFLFYTWSQVPESIQKKIIFFLGKQKFIKSFVFSSFYSPFTDIRTVATMINSFGKLGYPDLADEFFKKEKDIVLITHILKKIKKQYSDELFLLKAKKKTILKRKNIWVYALSSKTIPTITGGFANILLSLSLIPLCIVYADIGSNQIKFSIRSKKAIKCWAQIKQNCFSFGGHTFAAGGIANIFLFKKICDTLVRVV